MCKRGSAQSFQTAVYILRFDGIVGCKSNDRVPAGLFLIQQIIAILLCQTEGIRLFRQTHIRIILAEQDTVFGTRGKHAVGFVHAFRDKIVDQYADIGFVAS